MDEIALHIDFLLHSHDCVIVPDLGGFVVNASKVERNGLWGLDAPACELIFNSKLTYNDGLLAESIMKTNNVSYESAINKIELACDRLRNKLTKEGEVIWENLGTFKQDNEKRPVFLSNKSYVRPSFYGLTNARLKPAAFASSKTDDNQNLIPIKPFIKYVSSGIAVALLFFFIVISYNNYGPKNQQAEIVSKSLIFNRNKSIKATFNTNSLTNESKLHENYNEIDDQASYSPTINVGSSFNQSISISKSNYYIIVGVYEVRDVAEKALSALKEQGFIGASILKRSGRLDVYTASFANKEQAQKSLRKLHIDYPRYHDAWLLKR
ncbi:MAG TPA: SPOR domain-containing protein [Dysgonamonadaceae bacterium]|nr:SPOR domain-containing protein [Dysgonamonadaceae bacterium]